MKANNKSGNATTVEQWHHLFCFFTFWFISPLCAELWKEERTNEWHIRATSEQARLVSQVLFCILFYHIIAFHLL